MICILLLAATLAVQGCSDTEKTEAEPGSIQSQAEEIGHEAARALKTPMDQASNRAGQENLRIQQMEDRLDKIE